MHLPGQTDPKALVLVIDDEPTVRTVTARALLSFGYAPLLADSGEAGLELVATRGAEIVAILLDLTMPGMSGEETLRAIHATFPDTPVVLMSGYDAMQVGPLANDGAVKGFLHKPFMLEELRSALREVIPA